MKRQCVFDAERHQQRAVTISHASQCKPFLFLVPATSAFSSASLLPGDRKKADVSPSNSKKRKQCVENASAVASAVTATATSEFDSPEESRRDADNDVIMAPAAPPPMCFLPKVRRLLPLSALKQKKYELLAQQKQQQPIQFAFLQAGPWSPDTLRNILSDSDLQDMDAAMRIREFTYLSPVADAYAKWDGRFAPATVQATLTAHARATLVTWLMEVGFEAYCYQETIHLATQYLDRFIIMDQDARIAAAALAVRSTTLDQSTEKKKKRHWECWDSDSDSDDDQRKKPQKIKKCHETLRASSETKRLRQDNTPSGRRMPVNLSNFQLVGITCLFMASKFNEVIPLENKYCSMATDSTYSEFDVLCAERNVWFWLGQQLHTPTLCFWTHLFMARLARIFHAGQHAGASGWVAHLLQASVQTMDDFFDIVLSSSFMLQFLPSEQAAAWVYHLSMCQREPCLPAAPVTLADADQQQLVLQRITGYDLARVTPCVRMLRSHVVPLLGTFRSAPVPLQQERGVIDKSFAPPAEDAYCTQRHPRELLIVLRKITMSSDSSAKSLIPELQV